MHNAIPLQAFRAGSMAEVVHSG